MASGVQVIEQRLRLFQVERVEALSQLAVDRSKQFARLLNLTLVAPEAREVRCGSDLLAPATISDNTNSNAATNGQLFHTRRHWFAAKSLSWRSRTRFWTLVGTPPKEAAAHRVMHKKVQVRALWSRTAKALTE